MTRPIYKTNHVDMAITQPRMNAGSSYTHGAVLHVSYEPSLSVLGDNPMIQAMPLAKAATIDWAPMFDCPSLAYVVLLLSPLNLLYSLGGQIRAEDLDQVSSY